MLWQNISDATTRLAIRRLFALYLFISAIALLFPYRPAVWLVLLAFHAAGIALLLKPSLLNRFNQVSPTAARVFGDWYLPILVPALYTELATLNFCIYNGRYFDRMIQGWEQALFGGQPSSELARALPSLALSEFFHFSYISYYLIIYGPLFFLYLSGKREAYSRMVFNLMLAFFAHYIFFIYFPVQGPRYLFVAPSGEISHGFFYQLAHHLLETGSSRGAAFPSSHVGVSFAQTAFAFLISRRLGIILLVLSSALAIGAVYGGFHYGTDVIVGLVYGLLLFALAPRIACWLAKPTKT